MRNNPQLPLPRAVFGRITANPEVIPKWGMIALWLGDQRAMKQKPGSPHKRKHPKTHLQLPDLEYSKTAVLNSLTSTDGQRGYGHAIDEFVDWYCSEPRLALNRTVVLRYRGYLEARQLAPEPSTFDLALFGASPMRRRTPAS